LAQTVSHILNPGMVALGVFGGLAPWGSIWSTGIGLVGFGGLPGVMLLYLRYRGRVTSLYLPERQQRQRLLLGGVCCYFIGWLLLLWLPASQPLLAAGAIFWVNALSVWAINHWWKISIHATGVGGGVVILMAAWGGGEALLCLPPLVIWARLRLKAHTLAQVLAGTCLGGASAAVLFFVING
jgi:membrane-associated phospholipid phosphatase